MNYNKDTITVREAFNEFLDYCKVKNLSEATFEYYTQCYKKFTSFYSEDNHVKDINEKLIQKYTIQLQEDDNTNDISVNTRLRGIRVILYYFMKLGYTPKFHISLIHAEKEIKETYTDEELEILLKRPTTKKFGDYRNWVIINFLIGTGVRLRTLRNIKCKDIKLQDGYIVLEKTKNKRQQLIPLSESLAKILREYLRIRNGNDEDYLFCNIYGKQLTMDSVQHAITKYNRKRGVMKTGIHLFRHTFAKKWILAGGDPFRLQKILGHRDISMVKEYVDLFLPDIKKDFDKFNALEQLQPAKNKILMKRK